MADEEEAIRVHSRVDPGLLESAYEACLIYELEKQRLRVRRQVAIQLHYDDIVVDQGYRLDVLIESMVVVELKAVPTIRPVHRAQLLSYLRLGGFKLGYILNFHVTQMRDGVVRMVNGL